MSKPLRAPIPDEIPKNRVHTRRPLDLKAGAFLLFLATLWSGNSIAIKFGLLYAPPLRQAWMRFVLGSLVILGWAIYTKADLRIRREEWWPLLSLSLFFSVQIITMNLGIKNTTAGHATVLLMTACIWIVVLSHFFIPGDRFDPTRFAGILVAYLGIAVISADGLGNSGGESLILGDMLTVISAFLLGVRQVYNARLVSTIDPAKMLLFQAAFGTATFAIGSYLFEPEPSIWTWGLFGALAYQGLVIAGFGFLTSLLMFKYYYPSRITAVSLTQPVLGILLAWIILGEEPTWLLWVGGLFVMFGALLAQKRNPAEPVRDRGEMPRSLSTSSRIDGAIPPGEVPLGRKTKHP